jgi:hypothetical protein
MTIIREEVEQKNSETLTRSHWWQLADLSIFGIWLALVALVLRHHEPWADEAQSWLLARDMSLKTLWFHELRYEGTPGLWQTLLWIAQHWFHAPYAFMGVIGYLCASAGAAFILWKAPFPRPLRYLLVFSYFIVYQYAVVARSYNLLPLLVFAAAYFYKDREHPWRLTLVLILLANVAVHGALLAACLGLCYLVEAIKEWPRLSESLRSRYVLCIGAMFLTFLFLFVILRPTPDVLEFARPSGMTTIDPALDKFRAVIDLAFFDNFWISALFLLLAGCWCVKRRKLLPFALSVSALILLYVKIHGRPHHIGTVFLAAIAGLWIAWPTSEEVRQFSSSSRLAMNGMIALLACLLCLNIWDASATITNDYRYPYSGSADAANFLKQVGAEKSTIFGYTYGVSAVQAYFDQNILANIPTTYFHEGLPLHGFPLDLEELRSAAPQYVLIFSNAPKRDFGNLNQVLNQSGYHLVHFSVGNVFFKRSAFDAADYLIYQRDAY